jgi:hypothetical protein
MEKIRIQDLDDGRVRISEGREGDWSHIDDCKKSVPLRLMYIPLIVL